MARLQTWLTGSQQYESVNQDDPDVATSEMTSSNEIPQEIGQQDNDSNSIKVYF